MNFSRLKPQYVSLHKANNQDSSDNNVYDPANSADNFIEASLTETYKSPVFTDSSQYVVAVERMELSLNGVPFYYADGEVIYVIERANPLNTTNVALNSHAYSLSQLLTILNATTFVDPITAGNFTIIFSLTKEGFISMTLQGGKSFVNIYLEFPRRLNMILGISTNAQTTGSIASSPIPRLDMGDNLQHIVLSSNLQTVSDVIGNAALQVLTDFAPPTSYSNSLGYTAGGALQQSGFSTNLRQKVIYNPNERRYLDLISPFGIQQITIDAYYTDIDGNNRKILLGLGGNFDIKLGFYLKA